jgi:hypothetical protein
MEQISNRYADITLGALILYTIILAFATMDEIFGWGILAPFF